MTTASAWISERQMLGPGYPPPGYGGGDPGYGYGKGDPGYGKGASGPYDYPPPAYGYGKGGAGSYDYPPAHGYGKGDPGYGKGSGGPYDYPPPGYDSYGKGYDGKGGYGYGAPPHGYPPQGYGPYGSPGYAPPGYGKGGYTEPAYGWGGPPPSSGWGPPPGYDSYGKGCDPYAKGGYPPPGPHAHGYGAKGAPPAHEMHGKGGNPPETRKRSPSPLPVKYDGPLKEVESSGPPLERHQGAQRDNRPAWMTRGVGVGTEILGAPSAEPGSELVKPGITRADLEKIEKGGLDDGPDPFGDFFKERSTSGAGQPQEPSGGMGRAPLPDQSALFSGSGPGGSGRAPLPDQSTLFSGSVPPGCESVEAVAQKAGGYKIKLCTFWPEGKCTRGENCTYAHGEADLRK